jgi:predicted nucleic acid-binding protein
MMSNLAAVLETPMTSRKKRIYLDVCAYCRPYDDQSQLKVRLETDAYYLVLKYVEQGQYELVVSPVHEAEVADIKDHRERVEVQQLLSAWRMKGGYPINEVRTRAEELVQKRFGVADAAHVAFAESTADAFVTCDAGLLSRCRATPSKVAAYGLVEFVAREGLK